MSKAADYQQEIRDAIEWLEKELESIMRYARVHVLPSGQIKAKHSYQTALTALRAQIEPGWIKVSPETMPKPGRDIFFQMLSGNVFAGQWDGKDFVGRCLRACPSVVLRFYEVPEPPREGE